MQNYVKTLELNLTKKRWTHYTLYSVTFALYFSTLHLHDFSSATNSPYVSWCFSGINLNILLKLLISYPTFITWNCTHLCLNNFIKKFRIAMPSRCVWRKSKFSFYLKVKITKGYYCNLKQILLTRLNF